MAADPSPDAPFHLRLANDHSRLEDLDTWIRRFATSHGLPDQAVFRLDLVLTEAVTNIMDYAHQLGGEGGIELVCAVRDGQIRVELADDGPPFDPTARAPATLPASLEEARPGGLGIHLMRRYTTHMEYHRENDRNVLCMSLPLAHPASPD